MAAVERYDYKTPRLFIDTSLAQDITIKADRAQANYLLNVLRLDDGSFVLLFNGKQGEWRARITKDGRKSCRFDLVEQTRPQPSPADLVYLFAPLKIGRQDYMVQKAVEMGVGQLQPVITQYTQNSKLNLDRLKANIMEAAEQCGILSVPIINAPEKLDKILRDWTPDRHIIYADENAPDGNFNDNIGHLKGEKHALLVGPEGGFSQSERDLLRSMEMVHPISLGPRILRADTAGVAALALLQSCIGDW